MRKGIKKIRSFQEAEKDTLKMYKKMSPAERLAQGMYLEWMAKKLSGYTYKDKEGFILE